MSWEGGSESTISVGLDENSMEYWRTKSTQLEKVVKTLSNHCVRVVEHHEDLLVKLKKNQDQYKKLKTKYLDQGEQIKRARDVLVPVSNELKVLREKYEIAVRCQMEAETFAVKTTSKNKELKRQSQMLFKNLETANVSIVDIDIDSLENTQADEEENEYIKKRDQQLDELEDQKVTLSLQVRDLTENLQEASEAKTRWREKFELIKQELRQANAVVKQQEDFLKQVASTSEKVYKEYNSMEESYRKEVLIRSEAERFAHRLSTQRDQARRESAMALSKIADNKKLMEAMIQIEELNSKSLGMKEEYERKIEQLEEQLKIAKDVYGTESLQEENEELNEESALLQEKLDTSDAEIKRLHTQFSDLTEKYKELESKYEEATKKSVPAPPPAPPPPPPIMKSGGFLSKLVGRKGQRDRAKEQLKKGGVVTNEAHSKAMEDMMKRINSGNIALRPTLQRRTQSLPDKEEPTAATELQSLLSKMRKSRSEDDLSVFGDTGVEEESELGKILRKRQEAMKAKDSAEDKKPPSEPQQSPLRTEPPPTQPKGNFRPVPRPRNLSTIQDEED